ncbi:MAG: histidine kinase [Bacteroidia bacterium]
MSIKHPISRKRIYLVLLALDSLTSISRFFLFPNQSMLFYLSLFVATFLLIALLWEFLLMASSFLEKYLPVADKPVTRIIVQVFLTFLCASLFGYSLFNTAEKVFNVVTPAILNALIPLLYFMSAVILNLIYFGAYYFGEWKEHFVRSERLQKEQAQVKYDALRNQLNPHFLFNALTSLNSLIFENQQLASDFLQQLSKVYRYTLEHKEKETVSLRTEMNFISNYISLFKIRFQDAITFKIELNEESKEKGIAPVTLQMLIENAVKHNIINNSNPLNILITADEDYLTVENSVNKKSQVETSNKQGLENFKALYQYLSDKSIEITETEKLFTVKIPLI